LWFMMPDVLFGSLHICINDFPQVFLT